MTDDKLLNRITTLGAEQQATKTRLDALDAELRPLVQQAGGGDPPAHYPTELASLTRWSRDQIRIIIDPGADRRGRKKRDENRAPKPFGRKPKPRAASGQTSAQ